MFTGWSGDIGDIDPTENPIQLSIIESKTVTATFEKKKYPLTVNIEGEGEVLEEIVNAGRTTDYDSGTTVKLTAQPADEWLFTGWSGDIGDIDPTENPIQLSIIESKTVTATFEKKKYPLTVNIEGEGEVLEEIVNAGRTTDYDSGTTVKLTAQPEDEWLFTGWSGDIGDIDPTENPIQLSIIESKTVTATFEKKKYPLTVNIEGEGEVLEEIVNAGRTTDYDSGTTVKLTAQPEDEWLFTGWSGDIGDIDPTENPIQLSIIESKTVTATFEKKKYPLTVNIEGEGEVLEEIVNAGRTTDYDSGTTVKLTAQPEDEWLFTGWSGDIGDIDPTENPIQLSIIESKTVTATFEKKKYPLTVNIEGEGEVLEEIVNAGRTTDYDSGTTVKLTAQPADEWLFTGWSGDIGDIDPTENPIQLSIIESKTVTATFEKKKYPLTVNIEGEGEVLEEIVNAGRTTDYNSGTTVKLTAQPEDEWLFTGWSGDIGDIDPTENPIQLSIIESKTVTATFEKKKYPLTVNIEGEGEVLEEIVNSGRTTDYNSGTTVKLTAQPEDEWVFTRWSGDIGDIEPTENPIQLSIIESKTVTATFELIPIYTLTVTTSEGGTVSTEGGEFEEGTEVEVTATPNEGYRFDGWEGIDSNENTITLTVTSDTELSPIFNLIIPTPTSYGVDEYWGKIVEFEPEIFFTDDISPIVRQGVIESINMAREYFGNYGPVEWWITGRDLSLTEDFTRLFIERREERNQLRGTFEEMYQRKYEDFYQQATGQAYSGLNGERGMGLHVLNMPGKRVDGNWNNDPNFNESEFLQQNLHHTLDTVIHEYFHLVHMANIFDHEGQENDCGNFKPSESGGTFWIEGGAMYYESYIPEKLFSDGVEIKWENVREGFFKDNMRRFMEEIKENRISCEKENFMDFCGGGSIQNNPCHPYRYGPWGVAYVNNKVNDPDAFWKTLIPLVNELGFEGAFQTTYGITLEQFNEEFTEFLELPIEQQLEIIPDI